MCMQIHIYLTETNGEKGDMNLKEQGGVCGRVWRKEKEENAEIIILKIKSILFKIMK